MTDVPEVSAIITTYRRADVLPRAIRSVLDQTVDHIEVIVVDDEPSEEAADVVRRIADPRVSYIAHETNRGLSAARNTGVRAARSPYVAFLDDDDEWAPEKLERQLEAMDECKGDVVVTSFELWRRPDGSETLRDIRLDGDVHETLLRDDMVHMQTLLVPTHSLRASGGFDEQLFHHEDLDMALRLSRDHPFVTVPEPLTVLHVTPGSLSRNIDNRIRALERIISKHVELREDRRLRSRWTYRLARLHGEAGDRSAWRHLLWRAVRLDPTNSRAAAMFAVSVVGGPALQLRLAAWRNRLGRRRRAAMRPRGQG